MAEAVLIATQERLQQTETHVRQLSDALDKLRHESSSAVAELRGQLERARLSSNGHSVKMTSLIHAKNHEPKIFAGKPDDDFKFFVKKMKGYCNANIAGFKKALEWAEDGKTVITDDDINLMEWEHMEKADGLLHEYLCMVTLGDALRLVEATPERGFEAWRQLKLRYNHTGGKFALDQVTHMLQRKACANLSDIPAAVDKLERDFREYELRSPHKFPQEWKLPLLRELLPAAHRKDLDMKFTLGEKDYQKMAQDIVKYVNEHRVTQSRGVKDMDIDAVEAEKRSWTDGEW